MCYKCRRKVNRFKCLMATGVLSGSSTRYTHNFFYLLSCGSVLGRCSHVEEDQSVQYPRVWSLCLQLGQCPTIDQDTGCYPAPITTGVCNQVLFQCFMGSPMVVLVWCRLSIPSTPITPGSVYPAVPWGPISGFPAGAWSSSDVMPLMSDVCSAPIYTALPRHTLICVLSHSYVRPG